jgi:hypothetical protein
MINLETTAIVFERDFPWSEILPPPLLLVYSLALLERTTFRLLHWQLQTLTWIAGPSTGRP